MRTTGKDEPADKGVDKGTEREGEARGRPYSASRHSESNSHHSGYTHGTMVGGGGGSAANVAKQQEYQVCVCVCMSGYEVCVRVCAPACVRVHVFAHSACPPHMPTARA